MAKRYSKRTTKKTTVKLSQKEAEDIINEEFTTEKGYRMRKRFIFKPEMPNNSGIKVDFNHEKDKGDN